MSDGDIYPQRQMRERNVCFLGLYGELLETKGGLNVAHLANEKDRFSSSVYEDFECSA